MYNSLFSLLGSAFLYKCLVSPAVKLHFYRKFACPILRSGLSIFALKLFLHLTEHAPAIHFLTGELPVEGKLYRDIFSLFYSLWTNPDCKVFEVVKYLLTTSSPNSRTWAIHLRNISKMYGIEDPLTCLERTPPTKNVFKRDILSKITSFHEKELRKIALSKSETSMKYLNVSLLGLAGRLHPSITGVPLRMRFVKCVLTSKCFLETT